MPINTFFGLNKPSLASSASPQQTIPVFSREFVPEKRVIGPILRLGVAWIIGFFLSSTLQAQEVTESYRNALVAFKSGHLEEAAKEVEKALAESPLESRPMLLRARIMIALKQYPEAEKDLQSVAKLAHASNIVNYYLGEVYYVQRRFSEAMTNFRIYHQLVPEDADGVLKLVYCEVALLSLGEAAHLANTLNFEDEKTPAAYFAKAAICWADEQSKPQSTPSATETYLQQAELLYGRMVYDSYLPDYLLLTAHQLK